MTPESAIALNALCPGSTSTNEFLDRMYSIDRFHQTLYYIIFFFFLNNIQNNFSKSYFIMNTILFFSNLRQRQYFFIRIIIKEYLTRTLLKFQNLIIHYQKLLRDFDPSLKTY